jgi:hypothetical protein
MLNRLRIPIQQKKKAMMLVKKFLALSDILLLIPMDFLTPLLSLQQISLIGLEQLKW